MPDNPSDLEQQLAQVVAECNKLKGQYNSLGASVDRQQRLLDLLKAFLTAIAVILLALGLSDECHNEIHLLLAGLSLGGVVYLASRDPVDPPHTEPVET